MHRTQISLEQTQYEALAQESKRLGISLSELVRRLVTGYFEQKPPHEDPLDMLAGIAAGSGEPVGREHNRYIYGKDAT